jgi:hypothetical protein
MFAADHATTHLPDYRRALSSLIALALVLSTLAAVPALRAGLEGVAPAAAASVDAAKKGAAALSGVRLAFEPNHGQADPRVDFSVKAGGASVYFTDRGVTNVLSRNEGKGAWVVKQRFVGTGGTEPHALSRAPGTVSYFRGSPENWITNISTHRAIVYRDLWPGIDMVWRGLAGALEYRFVVHPGADPSAIRLSADGATEISVGDQGALRLKTPAGNLSYAAPVAYQPGRSRRTEVKSGFALRGDTYGFRLGSYDAARRLVIDPTIVYAGYIGGSNTDQGMGVAVDSSGAAYVAGRTSSTEASFPVTGGPDASHNGGSNDAFVAKVAPSGASLSYAGYIGGSGADEAFGVAVDSSGAAYVVGLTNSTEATFPVTGGPDVTHNGGNDGFVAKVAPSGASLAYAGYIGGSITDVARGVAVDSSGAAYVAGDTSSTQATFPVTGGPDVTHNGGNDAFAAKVAPSGGSLAYAGYIGGSNTEQGMGVAVDSSGAAYVAGITNSPEATFPVTGGLDVTANGSDDAFAAKVAPSGASLSYAGYIGGSSFDWANGVAVDAAGAAYVVGQTASTGATFPVTGGPDPTYNGNEDAFVAKVAPSGALAYAGYIGGAATDRAFGVAVDDAGAAYVAGSAGSTEATFPVTGGPDLTWNGSADAFVAKVAPSGASLSYAGYIGGSGSDQGMGVAVDSSGAAYVGGSTDSTEATFPVTGGPDVTHNGGNDAFVTKVAWMLSVDDVTLAEGTGGTTNFVFTLQLSAPSDGTVSVDFVTLDGTAGSPGDYAHRTGTRTFFPGESRNKVTVPVVADAADEFNENFTLQLLDEKNAVVTDDSGTGTILDDDPRPTVSIGDATVTEGPAGTSKFAKFTVSLSAPSGKTVTVNYATANGTATAPSDYVAISPAKTLTFLPGVVTKTVKVKVKGDNQDEANETFFVNLSAPGNATLGDSQGLGTIQDDDP